MGSPGTVSYCTQGHAYAWRDSGEVETFEELPVRSHGSIPHTCPCGAEDWGMLPQYHGVVDAVNLFPDLFPLVGFDELGWEVWEMASFDDEGHPVFESRRKWMRIPRFILPQISFGEYEQLELLWFAARRDPARNI